MVWTVEVQAQAEIDLELIFDHLIEAYKGFGDSAAEAFERAATRIVEIKDSALGLASTPYVGTKREDFGPHIRNVTINRAVIWFQLDEDREQVQVLAFFFGGQDHQRHMLKRLLEGGLE